MRATPMRNGLIGLAISGAAVPVAVQRYNAGLRTDPAHEQTASVIPQMRMSDDAVTRAWRSASVATTAARAEKPAADAAGSEARGSMIARLIEKHSAYKVPQQLAEDIYDIALQEKIDPEIAFGLVRAESAFKSSATSHVGAMGLTQLMPKTAAWLEPGTTTRDLRDQKTNLRIGFGYLNDLIKKYDGDTRLALLAYNRGPGTVDRVLKRGGNPDNGYVEMVLKGKAH